MQEISPNKAAMLQHLEFLFSNARDYDDGRIEIAYTPSNSGAVNKAQYFDVTQLEDAAEFAFQKNKEIGVNVYVGAALRDPDTAPFGRSSANDFYAASCVWVDLDDADAARTAKDKYSKLPPSLIVVTGRTPNLRAQCWWKIMHPETDKDLLNENLAFICASLSGDKAVVDPARVMRLGGSVAWPKKDGRVPEVTEIVIPENSTKMVMIDHFKSYFPSVSAPPLLTANRAQTSGGVGAVRNPITQTINIGALLEQSRREGFWHVSMRDAIAAMVAKGWSDEQIRLSTNPYRRDRSLVDDLISPLIASARNKWGIAEPETGVEPERYNPETGEIIEKTFNLLYADDITPSLESTDFVEDFLCEDQFSVVYGESNCGKTFFMLDLAMHVALGIKWRDKEVKQGGVVYAALEGGSGTRNRIVAFKKRHAIAQPIPLAVIPSNINFLDPEGDITTLVNSIKGAQERLGDVRLIVIDTLARAISGGDENSSVDMGKLVVNADYIRSVTGAHIAFVHHSGKDTARGARGHSSLRAAVDTEIEISRFDEKSPSKIKVVKQREMEMIDEMAFSLERVVLGVNQRGKEITSCVVCPEQYQEQVRGIKMTPIQDFIYSSILGALIEHGSMRQPHKDMPLVKCISYDDLHYELEQRGYKAFLETEKKTSATQVKNATTNARIALQRMNKISFYGNYIWAIEGED